jgi:hypothetical protein
VATGRVVTVRCRVQHGEGQRLQGVPVPEEIAATLARYSFPADEQVASS